ncbi:SDR family oxidoreductase [Cryobacterium tepidiphilum]|uniref:SDR family oxidoreductase n=1 Tax=Cryobacterium tepidiphilum TaxID=2486026 RepID=A0A3M8KV76_9MICO|nr:SDR family oxidoreductase [Cryobacterium tepidiphilum]RNE57227.1 SDR family oxidoreductase [Cryobacterium tepidiphilum]
MSRIAILGGHGKVALHLARLLIDEGHDVSSVFRNPEHRDEVARTGAVPVVADLEQLDTDDLKTLLAGHDAVVWSAGAGGGNPRRTMVVDRDAAIRSMDAAAAARVKRYVMVSYFGARADHGVPADHPMHAYAEAKAAADDYLRRSSLQWTILGPSALTADPPTGLIDVGDQHTSATVPRQDVAAVAATVLSMPATAGFFIPFNIGSMPIHDALDAFVNPRAS